MQTNTVQKKRSQSPSQRRTPSPGGSRDAPEDREVGGPGEAERPGAVAGPAAGSLPQGGVGAEGWPGGRRKRRRADFTERLLRAGLSARWTGGGVAARLSCSLEGRKERGRDGSSRGGGGVGRRRSSELGRGDGWGDGPARPRFGLVIFQWNSSRTPFLRGRADRAEARRPRPSR